MSYIIEIPDDFQFTVPEETRANLSVMVDCSPNRSQSGRKDAEQIKESNN